MSTETVSGSERPTTIAHKQEADKDTWQTPPEILDVLTDYLTFDVDPCAGEGTDIAKDNVRLPRNGLAVQWNGVIFLNPPFSEKVKWLKKAVEEYQKGNADLIVVLTPDSTDVKSWWHGLIVPNATYTWFSHGRVDYIDPDTDDDESTSGATFGTALSFFGDVPEDLLKELDERGDLMKRNLFD